MHKTIMNWLYIEFRCMMVKAFRKGKTKVLRCISQKTKVKWDDSSFPVNKLIETEQKRKRKQNTTLFFCFKVIEPFVP